MLYVKLRIKSRDWTDVPTLNWGLQSTSLQIYDYMILYSDINHK